MRVTNNHKTDLGLPNGQVLRSGQPTDVRGWDQVKDNAVIAAWVKSGILTVNGSAAVDSALNIASTDKDALVARLAELGVKTDKRKTVDTLQAMVAEAEAKERSAQLDILVGSDLLPSDVEIAEGQTVQLGDVVARAHAASGLTAEAWNALPGDEREALLAAEVDKMKAEAAQG